MLVISQKSICRGFCLMLQPFRRTCLASIAVALAAWNIPLRADEANLAAPPIQTYGDTNKNCIEWSDNCRICRMDEGETHCSTVGIACQPSKIICKVTREK
jgi:hypothetical protein